MGLEPKTDILRVRGAAHCATPSILESNNTGYAEFVFTLNVYTYSSGRRK